MTQIETLPDDEPNAFSVLETPAEVMGFYWKLEGEQCLRELLEALLDNNIIFREDLEKAAITLAEVGLGRPAEIVASFADAAPSAETANPYPAGSTDAADWIARFRRRKRRRESND
jgi:hypothetical protein